MCVTYTHVHDYTCAFVCIFRKFQHLLVIVQATSLTVVELATYYISSQPYNLYEGIQ